MAVLLALGSALTYGVGDFLGGLASRRTSAWTVVVWSQLCGLILLIGATTFVSSDSWHVRDLGFGFAAGLAGVVALTQFYRALADGAMSAVAPISAVLSAVVPVVTGVWLGERPATLAWVGIACALPAIALVGSGDGGGSIGRNGADCVVLVRAVVAGAGFGIFFVLLGRTSGGSGLVPLIAARSASVVTVAAIGSVQHRFSGVDRRTALTIVGAGVFDVAANVFFLFAVRRGLLVLGAVVAAMYPASTLVLARVVLAERLRRPQVVGLMAAAVAITLVAAA